MEYNGVIGEEMRNKTPSPNVVVRGKNQALTSSSEGIRRGEKWKKWRREEEEESCSNFKHDEAPVLNIGFLINDKVVVEDNTFELNLLKSRYSRQRSLLRCRLRVMWSRQTRLGNSFKHTLFKKKI